jgi:hypothetical protein
MAIAAGDPQRANRFCDRPDPVGAGFVDSLAKPGGNATGFMTFEPGISAKWLELLKELVPGMRRTAVLRDPTITAGIGMWSAIQAVSPSLGVELRPQRIRNRACRRGIRACPERRHDPNRERTSGAIRSSRRRPGTDCPRCTTNVSLLVLAA